MGETLAQLLQDAVQEVIDDDETEETSRADVVGLITEGSGVERGTINEIIDGDIECPPPDRLPPLAADLPVSQDDIENALADDGCEEFQRTAKSLSYQRLATQREHEIDPNA